MKKVLLVICCLGLLWSGCTEHNAPIDFSSAKFSDTSYVSLPAPAADVHQVLAEEFTGQSCANCPSAHTALENQSNQNPGRINIIGLYYYGSPQSNPVTGSANDLRDSDATQINTHIYNGGVGLPSGGIDRMPAVAGGNICTYQSDWSGIISNRLNVIDPLNLSIQSTYNTTANIATIIAKITYLTNVTAPQYLSIAVVEDTIYDKQENGLTIDDNYLFTNVCRGFVTSLPLGDPLGSATLKQETGRVFQKVYAYKLKTKSPAINPAHCRVIAYVNNDGTGGNYEVIQSAQCRLK
jgi:hypothetical protein